MKRNLSLIVPVAIALLAGCGGSSHNDSTPVTPAAPKATKLVYTDPTSAAGDWKLVKDATATGTHLVLNLVGPTDGSKYRGVGFTLQLDPTLVKIAKFTDGKGNSLGYYLDGGILLDKNLVDGNKDMAPSLQAGGVSNGKLMVGIFQKTDEGVWGAAKGATAKDCNAVVLQVAIDFDATLKAPVGAAPLTVLKARAIPEHVGTIANRKLNDISLKVGTLALQ